MRLWYKQPANTWTEALPLGNGRIGAMVYGGITEDIISLNEDTLWSGYPRKMNEQETSKSAYENILKMRETLIAGHKAEADRFIENHILGRYSQSYLPLGDIKIAFPDLGPISGYVRLLDLETGTMKVIYDRGDVELHREAFVSKKDEALVIKLSADKPKNVDFSVSLDSQLRHTAVAMKKEGDVSNHHLKGVICLNGLAPSEDYPSYICDDPKIGLIYEEEDEKKGMRFGAMLEVRVEGGSTEISEDCITVKGADRADLRLYTRTSFNGYDHHPYTDGADYETALLNDANQAAEFEYDILKKRHMVDYQKIYGRVGLRFAAEEGETMPTDERLKSFLKTQDDPYLYGLMYQYARYLTISASRKGTQPMNLQGIWNNLLQPPFSCNYTTNINLEMNYWGVDSQNLFELNEPLFSFMKVLSKTGAETAQVYYHAKGAVVHHNTDIWGMATPVGEKNFGMSTCGFWNMGYAWLSRHLFDHYEYTLDRKFLEEECYPILRNAAEYLLDIMVVGKDGKYIFPASTSPENAFLYDNEAVHSTLYTTMTVSIAKEVFTNVLKSTQILSEEKPDSNSLIFLTEQKRKERKAHEGEERETREEFAVRVKEAMEKLPNYSIGMDGQLLEWDHEYSEIEPHHRHISHLYSLCPGDEFHMMEPEEKEKMFEACRTSLAGRTDVGTGWSLGWKINAYARLGDGDHALALLKKQLHLTNEQTIILAEGEGAGTYPNLFDAHPPFQIDGNFAAASGISQMLLQSYENKVFLLPALPSELPDGQACGIRVKGGLEIDLFFTNGALLEARVYSKTKQPRDIHFLYAGKEIVKHIDSLEEFVLRKQDFA